jgi:hypothetical protein
MVSATSLVQADGIDLCEHNSKILGAVFSSHTLLLFFYVQAIVSTAGCKSRFVPWM